LDPGIHQGLRVDENGGTTTTKLFVPYAIKKITSNLNADDFFNLLSCQGSNLDSSDPESDVLPVTPQDNMHMKHSFLKSGCKNIKTFII
jgi:hypothetical protein